MAYNIARRLGQDRCALIAQDNYYIDVRILCPDGGLPDFDDPSSLEWPLLAKHLSALKSGETIDMPSYDFTVHQRRAERSRVRPKPVIILEGILILSQDNIREKLDHSLFIQCDREQRLERRFQRDVAERGRTEQSVFKQFYENVDPSQDRWVDPSAHHAGRILSQEEYLSGGENLVTELIDHWTEG